MRLYETVFVLDPSLDEPAIEKEISRVEDLITNHKGSIKKREKWGMKKFAYPIRRKIQGYYTLIYFEGDGDIPAELERSYKLNEHCLRYLTVVSEEKDKQPEKEESKQNSKRSQSSS